MRSFQITPVIGLPKFDGWAQMVTPSEHVQLVVAISGPNAQVIGRELLEWLDEQLFATAQEIHQVLETVIEKAKEGGTEPQLAFHAKLAEGHVFAAYKGSVVLKRGEKVGVLLPVSDQMNFVLGNVNHGDVFILGTEQASPLLGTIQQQLQQGFDVDSIITTTVPIMHGQEDSSLSALVFGDVLPPQLIEEEAFDLEHEAYEEPSYVDHYPEALTDALPDAPKVLSEELPPALVVSGLAEQKPSQAEQQKIFAEKTRAVLKKVGPALKGLGAFILKGGKTVVAAVQRQKSGGVYVEKQDLRKWAKIAVPIIVVIVGIGVFAGVSFARKSQQINEANEAVAPLNAMLQSSREDVNNNPIAARQEVSQVIGQLEQMEQAWKDKPEGQKRVIATLNEARQLYQDISGREEFKELTQFYDLRLTSSGEGTFLAQASFNEGSQAVFVDKDRKEMVTLDLSNKQFKRQKTPDDANVKEITLEGKTVWMLGGGLRRQPLSATAAAQLARPEEDANRAATLIQAYGPNLYILNPEVQTIYRYAPSDTNYADPTNWIRSSQGITFDQVTSMAIDGDLWLGTRDGQIKKLTSGRPVEFTITGLSDPFSSSLMVVTDENTENIYVLEPNKSRVVVLNKKGEYLREFKSSSLAAATDILVDEKNKMLLAVSGSLLLSLPL